MPFRATAHKRDMWYWKGHRNRSFPLSVKKSKYYRLKSPQTLSTKQKILWMSKKMHITQMKLHFPGQASVILMQRNRGAWLILVWKTKKKNTMVYIVLFCFVCLALYRKSKMYHDLWDHVCEHSLSRTYQSGDRHTSEIIQNFKH